MVSVVAIVSVVVMEVVSVVVTVSVVVVASAVSVAVMMAVTIVLWLWWWSWRLKWPQIAKPVAVVVAVTRDCDGCGWVQELGRLPTAAIVPAPTFGFATVASTHSIDRD